MTKLTFLGDIMCEPTVLKFAKQKDGSYNFDEIFSKIKPLLDESDFVVGNMEFPLAGEEVEYTKSFYVFNAPDSYANAIKNAGIDLVSTVNNHTFDRGADGMIRTIKALDEVGLAHTGTFLPENGREEAFYITINGVKIAIVAYSYACNRAIADDDERLPMINLLRPQRLSSYTPEVQKMMRSWVDKVFKKIKSEKRATIKKWLGMKHAFARADDVTHEDKIGPFIEQFQNDIRLAKQNADFVICYPHVGGQFNPKPGKFSKLVIQKALEAGADAIFAHHSHMVQRAKMIDSVPVAFCLGNFNMAKSDIVVKNHLPEFCILCHLYLDGNKIEKTTFTIAKAVQERGKQIVNWPVDELYASLKSKRAKKKLLNDIRQVYRYATDSELPEGEILREYPLVK